MTLKGYDFLTFLYTLPYNIEHSSLSMNFEEDFYLAIRLTIVII